MRIKLFKITAFCFLMLFFTACTKTEGIGGNSHITGNVVYNKYDPTLTTWITSYAAMDERVYIQYGDETGISDDVDTDYNGNFSFQYLYPGQYTIWVYSDDTTFQNSSGILVAKKIITLDKKQSQNIGAINIAGTK